ncbi:MAG: hypothetical protein GF346_05580, partial [Candidatus Eisenbacteria bacterium]|nr:hypothetical protein [Candidatus Latescibacterota bacterium]MBD3301899.1 hypothetical protein [Candidatus Eisenbacteria bacterium]
MRILGITLALWITAGIPAEGSTVFNSNGYGWWWDEGDPAVIGRGGTATASTEYGISGAGNPASIAAAEVTTGFVSYGAEATRVKGDEGSFRQRADLLPHFGGIVILPEGLRIGGFFRVQSDATYSRKVRREGDTPSTLWTTGKGGWTRLQVELAGSAFGRRLLWGGAVSRIQGTVKEEWTVEFDDSRFRRHRQINEGRM